MIGSAGKEVEFRVFEKTNPTRQLTFTAVASDGTQQLYDFGPVSEIEFYVKVDVKDADGAALLAYTYTGGDIIKVMPEDQGRIQIVFPPGDLDDPGRYRHYLAVTTPAGRDVLMWGPFVIQNV